MVSCQGTPYVGHLEDALGGIDDACCDSCRTIVVDAWDRRRKSWRITYLDPAIL